MLKTIKVNNIIKKFKTNVVLNNVSFEIHQGESVAFLGSNGSGKTTLVEIIAGLQNPTSGTVFFDEKTPEKFTNLGIQFQEGMWPKGTTGNDIIKFYFGKNYAQSEKIQKIIDIFEIKSILKADLNNLSGGQKQRFNAFLAVSNEPEVIILDELITSLDLKMQIKLIDYFKEYQKENKTTLLIISHMPEEVEIMCKRIILLEQGNLILDANVSDVVKKHGSIRKMIVKHYAGKKI
ncbi:ATP-binding cassette domain-containing protein [Williamsoniiplasma luminosum]|uniref:ATP-binding cassette domain-containing protein n=1 Tax=Williamsoniiplasma luminosum TaxID=214888 RepID=UPI0026C1E8F8|nr:ABC transporter ATP-binding protein [Williamsoniiplasma luminosum]